MIKLIKKNISNVDMQKTEFDVVTILMIILLIVLVIWFIVQVAK